VTGVGGAGTELPPPPAEGSGARALGLPEDLWALACYLPLCGAGAFVSALALVSVARRRPRLRFHAWQGLLLSGAALVVALGPWLGSYALEAAGLPSLGGAVVVGQLAAGCAVLVAALWMMATAYHRRDRALPLLGALARRWSGFAAS
jgi:uncharacterized membrane protein